MQIVSLGDNLYEKSKPVFFFLYKNQNSSVRNITQNAKR